MGLSEAKLALYVRAQKTSAELKKAAEEFASILREVNEAYVSLVESNKRRNMGIQDALEKLKSAGPLERAKIIDEIKKQPGLSKEDHKALDILKEKLPSAEKARGTLIKALTNFDIVHKVFRAACPEYKLPTLSKKLSVQTKQRATMPKEDGAKTVPDDKSPSESWVQNDHGGYDIFVFKGDNIRTVKDTTQSSTYNERIQLKAEANVRKGAPPMEVISRIEREDEGQKSPSSTPYSAQPQRQSSKESGWTRKLGS